MRRSGSTRTPRRKLMSIIRPPSQSAVPATLWPPPRTDNGTPFSRAKFTQATTSALPLTRAIRAGRFAIIAFQIVRLDHPNLLKLLQSQAEQATRHQWNAAVKIAEMRAAAQQFTQHKRRPAFGEDFGALGDRAELTVAFHRHLHFASDDVLTIVARGLPTSPNSGLRRRSHDARSELLDGAL